MPRPRAGYVRPVTVPLTDTEKRDARSAADLDERPLTLWITRAVRSALDSGLLLPHREKRAPGRLHLELPGDLVDELERHVGPRNVGPYVRHAILSAARIPA